jgi:thiamine kinase-like enzyme
MVNWLKHVLDSEWLIRPAGGLTGDAFIAEKGDQRLFLKRNSAPFLAVLSAQGIVPKLIWTKRMENGDVITAQKWLEGRRLRPEEMKNKQVIDILQRIHHSSELLHMLMRLGNRSTTPAENYEQIVQQFEKNSLISKYKMIKLGLSYLQQLLPVTEGQEQVVCHCDLNHNNLIVTNEGQLYLIDWDNAKIADPIIDFGMIMKWYVPESDWDLWLKEQGINKDSHLIGRMHWYLLYHTLYYINWHERRNESDKVLEHLEALQDINKYIKNVILN